MNARAAGYGYQPVRSGFFPAGIVVSLVFVVLAGCAQQPPSKGVVARVNGDPVYLSEVRADHDLHYMTWSSANDFDVQSLGHEYGTVLADIILQRLILQTLSAEHLDVSDEDVAREEALIRADYPDDISFEQTLIDEYVDLDQWREQLRSRLSRQRFLDDYLRPRVTIGYEAARDYYRDHRSDFVVPERFVFTVFHGKDRESLTAALAAYRQAGNATPENGKKIEDGHDVVDIHDMDVPDHALSSSWREILAGLAPQDASEVIAGKNAMTILFLHERTPRTVLSPSAAYPLVEHKLVEQGMKDAFDAWMEHVLAHAKIEITGLLRENRSQSQDASGEKDL